MGGFMNVRSLAALLLTLVALTAACSSSSALAPAADGGSDAAVGDDAGPAAWLAGACGSCVQTACTSQRQVCDAEPSCALHSACADACASAPGGIIDAACLAACPRGDNAVASRSRAAYDACITGSGVAGCTKCTKPTTSDPVSFAEILDQKCGPSTETNACFKCEAERCCETFDACVAEPECKLQLQPCLVACKGDKACQGRCYAAHPKGVSAWARRSTCNVARCATECGGTVDACAACGITTTCREPNARCTADAGCFLLRACLDETCPTIDDACIKTCKAKVPPTAGPLFDAWFACISVSCVSACN